MEHMLDIIECISTSVFVIFIVAIIISEVTLEVFHFLIRTILAGLAFAIKIPELIIEIYLGINCVNTIIMLLVWIVLFVIMLCSLISIIVDLAIENVEVILEDYQEDSDDENNEK